MRDGLVHILVVIIVLVASETSLGESFLGGIIDTNTASSTRNDSTGVDLLEFLTSRSAADRTRRVT